MPCTLKWIEQQSNEPDAKAILPEPRSVQKANSYQFASMKMSTYMVFLFMAIVLTILPQRTYGRVLQTGESFVLQFTNLPYAFPSSANPPDQYLFQTGVQLRLSPGASYHVELFADNTSQSPFLAEDYSYGTGRGGIGTYWQDLQGAVRVTSMTGTVDMAAMWIVATTGGGQYEQLYSIPPTAPPLISLHPSNITAIAGSIVSLSSDGYGMPLAYQWRRNGTNIIGATNSLLTLTNVQVADSGAYRAVLTNSAGASTTAVANVTIQFGTDLELQFRPVVTVRGWIGSNYRLEYCENLASGSWTPLTNFALETSPYYFTDIQAIPQQRRFYRVVLIP